MAESQNAGGTIASPTTVRPVEVAASVPMSTHSASTSASSPATPAASTSASGGGAGQPAVAEPCPYCGEPADRSAPSEQAAGTPRCRACLAFLDPLSREVTQGHMGPWFLRDETRPFYPGVAFEVLATLVARGEVTRQTILRGPGTGQFWMLAGRTPGVAHLLGVCHACQGDVSKAQAASGSCGVCGARFPAFVERDRLGIVGATSAQRISAFASDEELRRGAPAPSAAPRPAAPAPALGAPVVVARESGRSPLEITLSEEVAAERRKTLWLLLAVGSLLVVNLSIALWALLGMRRGG